MIFRTLKFQIMAAFTLLALPLILLAYFIFESHNTFTNTMVKTLEQEKLLTLTASIQRDVMDLQRNILVYKDSPSKTVIANFHKLYDGLTENIETLENQGFDESYKSSISSITTHLNEYKNNFDIVVSYRRQRDNLVEDLLNTDIDMLMNSIENVGKETITIQQEKIQLLLARSNSLSYLANNDTKFIDQFKNDIGIVKRKIGEGNSNFLERISTYESNVLKIVTLTRNYVYLINVVMTGSVQEILYHSALLANISQERSVKRHGDTSHQLNQRKQLVIFLSSFGLLLAVFVPFYFFRMVTKPIASITHVFNELAAGNTVTEIPGKDRPDEIGSLAVAADVFKAKNEQTLALLRQSELSVEIQQTLNAELTEAKVRAEKSLSVKTDFLANMSHELRTPLNSVIGYAVRLLKKPDGFNDRQLTALKTIERNGLHLLAMINDILDFSKIEAQKLDMNFQSVDINNLCSEAIQQLQAECDSKSLLLIYKPLDKTLMIESDPVRLTQVLINILSNSVKYTLDGWVKLEITPLSCGQSIAIAVTDSGIGIKEEDMSRLFKRFEQFDQDTRFKIGHGTGLGLAIVANLSRLLGIKINIESTFGEGTRFYMKIPIQREQPLTQ